MYLIAHYSPIKGVSELNADLFSWSQVKARAPCCSLDLTLVVEIATRHLDSKENKVLGIEKNKKYKNYQ